MLGQLGRFGIVGVIATLLHLVAAFLAKEVAGLSAQLANLVGFGVAFGFSFLGHLRFTFDIKGPAQTYFNKFLVVSVAGFIVSSSIVLAATTYFGWSFNAALLVVGIAIPILSFFVSKYWTFRDRQTPNPYASRRLCPC